MFSHVNQLTRLDQLELVARPPLLFIIEEETARAAAHDEPAFLFVLLVQREFLGTLRTVSHGLGSSESVPNRNEHVPNVVFQSVAQNEVDCSPQTEPQQDFADAKDYFH